VLQDAQNLDVHLVEHDLNRLRPGPWPGVDCPLEHFSTAGGDGCVSESVYCVKRGDAI
jgi:hypothetical protein